METTIIIFTRYLALAVLSVGGIVFIDYLGSKTHCGFDPVFVEFTAKIWATLFVCLAASDISDATGAAWIIIPMAIAVMAIW